MYKVLWFSRHEMTEEQRAALEKKLGEIAVTQISKTIASAFELQAEIEAADVVAIVAPVNIQAQFLKIAGTHPMILAQSKRELVKSESGGEDETKFIFEGWKQLKEIRVVLEDFC